MTFHELARVFETIAPESSRLKITEHLAQLFSRATVAEARVIAYLALGTLRAPYKNIQFNFAAKNSTKLIALLLDMPLHEYTALVKKTGDLGASIMQLNWPFTGAGLSVEYIYHQLEKLQAITGTGAQQEKALLLAQLLQQTDALSASYIVRIILGTMRLGFSALTIVDALSWMITGDKSLREKIESAYNKAADIGLIAERLKQEGLEGLSSITLMLGIPINPAAAERLPTPEAIIEKIGPCVAQPKLDGFRVQIHIAHIAGQKEPTIWFFSRNLLDISQMFPDIKKALVACGHTNIIIEGEALVYNYKTKKFLPFQQTVKRKRKHAIEDVLQELPLQLFLFDILLYNNQSILSQPQHQRRALLLKLYGQPCVSPPVSAHTQKQEEQVIHVISEQYTKTSQELDVYFKQQLARNFEGIIAKRPDAPYQAGKRNFNWIKLKKQSHTNLNDTLDVVVLGYYSGRGKRVHFGIGAFLVGVYNSKLDRFETIAKIGTGMTDIQWRELKATCDAHAVAEQPSNIYCSAQLIPDVWVQPSFVVVAQADEITQSPLHTAGRDISYDKTITPGLALRFPRFIGYSIDKRPEQATTVEEIQKLYEQQFSA